MENSKPGRGSRAKPQRGVGDLPRCVRDARFCPAASAFLVQGPPLWNFTKKIRGNGKTKNQKPSANGLPGEYSQRVSGADFFGASSVASALDIRLGRDPEANENQLTTRSTGSPAK
jgi:hypothetical protein